MEKSEGQPLDVRSDVLHIESHTRLSPEEIAKALAHHKRHHHDGPATGKAAQMPGGKKSK